MLRRLEAKSLAKASIPCTLFGDPSPGHLQATRLALHANEVGGSSCSVYVASGCHVYRIEIRLEGCVISKGKESLLVPVHTEVINASMLDRCPHRSEIQSIVLSQSKAGDDCFLLGTVDLHGHLIVSRLNAIGADVDRVSYSVLPRDAGLGEGSWAGVSFSTTHWSMAAVARQFCKSIDIYDQDIHLRSLHTLWYPSSLEFLDCGQPITSSSLLAVAEGSQLSIWDMRMDNNGGCAQRVSGPVGDLIYSVCHSTSGLIAVGGSDRAVTIYDPRRWSPVARWVSCAKYEITGLSFSSIDPSSIYIQGVDYEVICGAWEQNEKTFSFRGDSNWLGFSKGVNDQDMIAGWCETGSVFVAEVQAAVEEPREASDSAACRA